MGMIIQNNLKILRYHYLLNLVAKTIKKKYIKILNILKKKMDSDKLSNSISNIYIFLLRNIMIYSFCIINGLKIPLESINLIKLLMYHK